VTTTTHVLGAIIVVAFGALGTAKLAGHPAMRARAAHVGFTTAAYRRIGALEVLAAAGIVAGLYNEKLAAAAATGLVLLLAGAVITHLRNGDRLREVSPALVLGAACFAFVASILTGQS
jgi:hypothetical protein